MNIRQFFILHEIATIFWCSCYCYWLLDLKNNILIGDYAQVWPMKISLHVALFAAGLLVFIAGFCRIVFQRKLAELSWLHGVRIVALVGLEVFTCFVFPDQQKSDFDSLFHCTATIVVLLTVFFAWKKVSKE